MKSNSNDKCVFITIIIVVLLIIGNLGSCSKEKDDPWTNVLGDPIVCRRSGCGETPVFADWNRRYCSEHIKETHYCRYPNCTEEISNLSTSQYCYKHD